MNHEIATVSRNSGQLSTAATPPKALVEKYCNLPSVFYTVDFAELDNGTCQKFLDTNSSCKQISTILIKHLHPLMKRILVNRMVKVSRKFCIFYTVDFAELDNGTWQIIEAGDGSVSGLSEGQDYKAFFRALYQCLL